MDSCMSPLKGSPVKPKTLKKEELDLNHALMIKSEE